MVSNVTSSRAFALFMLSGIPILAADRITIAGSTTVKPIVEIAARAFKERSRDLEFVIGAGGSGHGIRLVGEGAVNLGMASRPIDAKEKEQFGDLTDYKIGLDGVVLVANTSNRITNLTTEEVREIYTGRIINWTTLGDSNARIAPYTLNSNHGTNEVFLEYFGLDARESGAGEDMVASFRQHGNQAFSSVVVKVKEDHQRVLAEVMTNPGALGYVSLGQALRVIEKGARVRLLNLDNAHPSVRNTQSGAYPFSRPLLVVVKGQPNPALRAFVDFLLGPQGQAIVNRLAYIPAHSETARRAP